MTAGHKHAIHIGRSSIPILLLVLQVSMTPEAFENSGFTLSIDVFNKSGWMEATRYGKGRPSEPDAYAPRLQMQQEQAGLSPNAAA